MYIQPFTMKEFSKDDMADKSRTNLLTRSLISNPNVFFEQSTGEYYTYINIYNRPQLVKARAYLRHCALNKEAFDKNDFKWIIATEYTMTVEEAGL